MRRAFGTAVATTALLLGCATVPNGPSVMVLPADGKPFDEFRQDDQQCRQWAAEQNGSATGSANQALAGSALIGTAIGAGLGAAIGAAVGQPATGAAIGAGSGLFVGTLSGASSSAANGYAVQQRYDNSYVQCMYAYGNHVPSVTHAPRAALPPPPPYGPPAPTRSLPPPPPTGPPPPTPPYI